MTRMGVERTPITEANPLSHLLPAILPSEGLQLPEENRTVTSLSTRFEVHIIDNIPGVADTISARYPHFADAFPDILVIKTCSREAGGYFVHSGNLGQETLIRETEVALREGAVPIVLGLGWMGRAADGSQRLYGSPGKGREAVMAMAEYSEERNFERVVEDPSLGGAEQQGIMHSAVVRMLSLKQSLTAEAALRAGDVLGTQRLIEQTLERAKNWGPEMSPTSLRASEQFEMGYRELMNDAGMRAFISMEAAEGGVGDQHGDPRPFDNASILRDIYGFPTTVIRDPVRLYQTGEGGLPPGWTNFHLSHDYLQLGLLLGRAFTDERHHDLFRYGIQSYMNLAPSPRNQLIGDERREKYVGLGIAYDALVEIVVRGYSGDVGTGPTIEEYWLVNEELARSDFRGWKEEL